MSIQEKINADLKQAMLDKNDSKKSLLRVVIGEFNRVDKVVDDAKATGILKKMVENAKENLKRQEVTTDLYDSTELLIEISILEEYLPKQLDADRLSVIIAQIIKEGGFTTLKEMGLIMAQLKKDYAGQYDGKLANDLIKKLFI